MNQTVDFIKWRAVDFDGNMIYSMVDSPSSYV